MQEHPPPPQHHSAGAGEWLAANELDNHANIPWSRAAS